MFPGLFCTLAGNANSPFVFAATTFAPLLPVSEHGLVSLGFRWSFADNFGVLDRGADCTKVHIVRLFAGVRKAGLDVHDMSLARGSADVLGYELSPASACCSGTGKRIARIRWTVSVRRRMNSRAMELISDHESVLALSNRGALSIFDASFQFARTSYMLSRQPWLAVRMEQSIRWHSVSLQQWLETALA